MDKFVVRRAGPARQLPRRRGAPPLKQAKIEDLRGVVFMDDAQRLKQALDADPQDVAGMIMAMESLERKRVAKQLIKQMGLLPILSMLRVHGDTHVASLAKRLYATWSETVAAAPKPRLPVKREGPDEAVRQACCRQICSALGVPPPKQDLAASLAIRIDDDESAAECLARQIDDAIFDAVGHRRTGLRYRAAATRLASELRRRAQLCEKAWTGQLPAAVLGQRAAQDMDGLLAELDARSTHQ